MIERVLEGLAYAPEHPLWKAVEAVHKAFERAAKDDVMAATTTEEIWKAAGALESITNLMAELEEQTKAVKQAMEHEKSAGDD